MRFPLAKLWLPFVAIWKSSTISAGPETIRDFCLPPLMALSGKFLFVIFKKESGECMTAFLSLLVNELLFCAAPLGGASPPCNKRLTMSLRQQWHSMFGAKWWHTDSKELFKEHSSMHKRVFALFSCYCCRPSGSGMWRGFSQQRRRCFLIRPLCTVLSTTPPPRTWWWAAAMTRWYECGGLMSMTWTASCCRSLRVTAVSSTQFVLTLKVGIIFIVNAFTIRD